MSPGQLTHHELPPACSYPRPVRLHPASTHTSTVAGAQEADRRATQTHKEAAGMEEYSNVNRLYWLQLILYRHAFPTQAPTLSCSSSPRRPPRASPATPSPAQAPGCIPPGRLMPLGASTFCSTAAPPEEAAREPAHEAAASARQAWMGQGRGLDSCGTHEQVRTPGPAREASSAHGHVSGGKRQGLEAIGTLGRTPRRLFRKQTWVVPPGSFTWCGSFLEKLCAGVADRAGRAGPPASESHPSHRCSHTVVLSCMAPTGRDNRRCIQGTG
jgi:hypothetical protein